MPKEVLSKRDKLIKELEEQGSKLEEIYDPNFKTM